MVVTSGVVPYNYRTSAWDSSFHFRVPRNGVIAPSAVLFEEAMYVIKAEYTRRDAGGIVFSSETLGDYEAYNLYLSDNVQGRFDPDPNGRNLDGTNPVNVTTTEGVSYVSRSPATYHMKAYIVDMRETLREVLAQAALDAGGGISHWNTVQDWLNIYKGYTDDAFSDGSLFFNEEEIHPETFEPYSSGMLTSGVLWDRLLDEVRYQPMPFLSGFGGSFGFEAKGDMTVRPIRPVYWGTDGSLGPGWSTAEAYGDVLVSNAAILFSGGGYSGQGDDRHSSLLWTPNTVEDIQQSGSFPPIVGMTAGPYLAIVGNSGTGPESGLAPWGSGFSGFSRIARTPKTDANLPSGGGQQFALMVGDDVFAIQANLGGGGGLPESGLQWRMPMGDFVTQVDFYISNPQNSGIRRLWGNSLYAQVYSELGTNDLYRPGGWMYDRVNDKIHIVGNSGFASTHQNYPFGTGLITTFSPSLTYETHQTIPEITGAEPIAIKSLESITWDGSNYICHGYAERSYAGVTSGVVWKLDSSFNAVDMVSGMTDDTSSQLDNVQGRTFWHRGNSEYLFLSNSGAARRVLEEYPNRYFASGTYHVATFSWGAFTTPPGVMTVIAHVPTVAVAASSVWGPASRAGIRIVNLFNHEDSDDLYGMALAHNTAGGGGSGGTDNFSRYVIKFDDTGGHPYEISNAWLIGSDDAPNDLNTSIRNSKYMYFMDNFQF